MRGAVILLLVTGTRALVPSALRITRAVSPRMADLPGPEDLAALFEEKPPPTWGDPEWKWGSADGAAHTAAAKVRDDLSKKHRRQVFLRYAIEAEGFDISELKLTVALKCQHARNFGYDEPDGRWESLMEEMVACAFEGEEGLDKLAAAVNKRLPTPVDSDLPPTAIIAAGLAALDFVDKGL